MIFLLPGGAARAQISPGPLSHAHADLDSNQKCLECHGGGSGKLDGNCLSCHREIRWLRGNRRGLHWKERAHACADCHPEHAGRGFELIAWSGGSPQKFEHDGTGWPLEGAHARADCRACHRPEKQLAPLAALLERADRGTSWLGLDRDCRACHADRHQETLGGDCRACHGVEAWKPAPGFDHDRSAFALTGRHVDVPCERCHLVPGRVLMTGPEGEPVPRYKPVPHEECSSCHEDVHQGRLGPQCGSCHVTQDFNRVAREKFDHSKTRYTLAGKHRSVQCAACHDEKKAWGARPEFGTCNACHTEAHAGLATLSGRSVDCASCHDERGFDASTYSVADHARAEYPLEGRHAKVTCSKCHFKEPTRTDLGTARVELRPRFDTCDTCHEDAHRRQLAGRPDGGKCESCHDVEGWKPSRFGVVDHAPLRLPLEGRHAEIECAACHGPRRPGLPPLPGPEVLGPARVAFAVDIDCADCHRDPHVNHLEDDCGSCHDVVVFQPSTVDPERHGQFEYKLDGAHAAVPCNECHEELPVAAGSGTLAGTPNTAPPLTFERAHDSCKECHRSPHGDQFAHRTDLGECAGCHGPEAFRPASLFDHERDARFPLVGAHERVACEKCHPAQTDAEGRATVLYRPLARECQDCHGGVTPIPASASLERTRGDRDEVDRLYTTSTYRF